MNISGDLAAIFSFVLGAIVGSFLNVLILRYNTGLGIYGRSRCFSCGSPLRWYDLIPIVSFLALRSRCRYCGAKISVQYPIVELFSGLLFALFFIFARNNTFSISMFIPYLLCLWFSAAVLIFTLVYDLKHKIIPDSASIALAMVAIVFSVLTIGASQALFINLITALIISLIFASFWFISRGRAMGLGDAKLVFGLAVFLGYPMSISATVVAFWIGAAYALIIIAMDKASRIVATGGGDFQLSYSSKQITMKSELPFGPFLIIAALIVFFFEINAFVLFL